jgi:3-hydroxybutyryl-CoA dehydrogenase
MNAAANDLRIGIVGAGAMGSGIAQVAAAAGHPVVLADANAGAVQRARSGIRASLDKLAEKGKLEPEIADAIFNRISFHDEVLGADLKTYRDCGVVIEAVVENLAVKRMLFVALASAVAPSAILASNTSSLSIASIAIACANAERVVGIHFFNPAPILPLVEIVPWLGTSPAVTTSARSLIDSWGKTTVLAADTPGFIVNRVARPFYGESLRIYDEGIADFATIDWAMKEFGGFRMGPFELMDFIGNDVNFAVTSTMFESSFWEPRYRPSLTQKRLTDAGRFGRKSGVGYYRYDTAAKMPEPTRDRVLGARIFERVLAMLINEAADAAFYRVASVQDIDTAMKKGVNYPKGLLAWSDELGASWAFDRLVKLQDEYGEDRYRQSPLLKRLARENGRFHDEKRPTDP